MAVKLNLLPSDYALTGTMRQLIKVARQLNVILLAFFLIAGLGMGAYFVFSSVSLKGLVAKNDDFKSKIQAQTAAQQQIVLLKDRLTQIKIVRETPGATKNLNTINPLLTLVTGNSLLAELNVDSQKTSASIVFKSNSDLTNFIKNVKSSSAYPTISLGTFNYSPAEGYQVSLNFLNK